MNVPPERLELVRLWVEKAESDYRNFLNTLKMGDDCPYDTVCFHAQQGVEKYLKARLVYLSIDFTKTHDIGEIIKLLPPGSGFPLSLPEREKLTGYAWKGRYPGDHEIIDRKKAEEAASLALKVRTAVRSGLPKGILEDRPRAQEPQAVYRTGKPKIRSKARGSRNKGKKRK